MIKHHLRWELSYPYLTLIFISLLVFGFYSINVFEKSYISVTADNLKAKTLILKHDLIADTLVSSDKIDTARLKSFFAEFDKLSDTRITLILPSGKVINDTREDPSLMDNHLDRPEIKDAMQNGSGYSTRYSHTLRIDLMYFAVPIIAHNKIVVFLRTAVSLENIEAAMRQKLLNIIFGGLVILLVAVILGFFISKKLSAPLLEMKSGAEKFASGNFEHKIYPPKVLELESLAESLNTMARQINDKLTIISEQKNIQQSVLESMREGVIAADYNEQILLINKTAGYILGIPENDVKGKTLQESIRVPGIQNFFRKVFKEGTAQETEINIMEERDKILQLRGTPLYDAAQNELGVLVVINDITELKHLDNLKRDFVANVSHELKTPITTIKGFIETLREGAINEPENAQKFLDIVSKHAERLNLIIEDLLSLSRLEQKTTVKELKFLKENIKPVLASVIDDFEMKAREKHITIKLECSDDLSADINRPLIEEAVGNLIDNAVKYSERERTITVKSYENNGKFVPARPAESRRERTGFKRGIIISVKDEGHGIPEEHLPRIFERFYRVDKARSRDAGGTGLGLAIVKHIAQVHNGTVSVDSTVGKGSTFSIILPNESSTE